MTHNMRLPETTVLPTDVGALHTTLNMLRRQRACPEQYRILVKALGGPKFDHDAQINLLDILDANGPSDCLWAMRVTCEPTVRQMILIAADCAESVLHLCDAGGAKWAPKALAALREYARCESTPGQFREAIHHPGARIDWAAWTAAALAARALDCALVLGTPRSTGVSAWCAANTASMAALHPAFVGQDAGRGGIARVQSAIIRRYLTTKEQISERYATSRGCESAARYVLQLPGPNGAGNFGPGTPQRLGPLLPISPQGE